MHAIAEVILPPKVECLKTAVAQVMMCGRKEAQGPGTTEWWDWFVIGGRFSGAKTEASLDPATLDKFHEELKRRKVTVSGVVCGKQALEPVSQVPMVDALWREMFPGKGEKCWLFNHARGQYQEGGYEDDVCKVSDLPETYRACRLLIAGPGWDSNAKKRDWKSAECCYMIADEYWNGVIHDKTRWDGYVRKSLDELIAGKADCYHLKDSGLDDSWLCVTVDFHN